MEEKAFYQAQKVPSDTVFNNAEAITDQAR